jgi:hypothetical protein
MAPVLGDLAGGDSSLSHELKRHWPNSPSELGVVLGTEGAEWHKMGSCLKGSHFLFPPVHLSLFPPSIFRCRQK